jgi:hypothetical protein
MPRIQRLLLQSASTVLTELTLEQMAEQLEKTLQELAFREQDQASLHNELYDVPTISTANSFHAYPNPSPSYIYSTRERYVETTVRGDQILVDASSYVTSFNSGNSTVMITTGSNNRR